MILRHAIEKPQQVFQRHLPSLRHITGSPAGIYNYIFPLLRCSRRPGASNVGASRRPVRHSRRDTRSGKRSLTHEVIFA